MHDRRWIAKHRRRGDITPVGALLALAGMTHLQPYTSFMLCPAKAPPGKEHYLHNGKAWTADGVTLSRGDIKNRLNVSGGVLVADAAGVLGQNGQIEAAATKLCSNMSAWAAPVRATRTANQADLLGGTTAILLTEDGTAGNSHYINQTFTESAGARISMSAYVKRGSGTRHIIFRGYISTESSKLAYCGFNLDTLAVDQGKGTGDATAPTDGSIVSIGGGWFKLSCSFIISAGTAYNTATAEILMSSNGTYTGRSYNGDNASSIVLAHSQVEANAYRSTWINGASGTTRAADLLLYDLADLDTLKTAGSIAWIGRNQWSIAGVADARYMFGVTNLDAVDDSLLVYAYNGQPRFSLYSGLVEQCYISGNAVAANTVHALGISWAANSAKFFQDGVQVGATDTSITTPTALNRIRMGQANSGSGIYGTEHGALFVFNRVLTDTEWAGVLGAPMRSAIFGGL